MHQRHAPPFTLFLVLVASVFCDHRIVAQAPDDGLASPHVHIDGVEKLVPGSQRDQTYRAYEETRVLNIRVGVSHESSSVLLVDQDAIREGTRVRVTGEDGSDIPVSMRWFDGVLQYGDWGLVSKCVQGLVEIEPNFAPTWTVTVERRDGSPFVEGDYRISVDMPDLRTVLRKRDDTRWNGRQVNETWHLQLTIRQAGMRADRIAQYRWMANDAQFSRYAWDEAIEAYAHVLALDPDDISARTFQAGLLLMLGRFREAAANYEKLGFQDTHWRSLLARAYAGAGDEGNAIRVLRLNGMLENMIPAALQELRRQVKTRNPWAERRPLVPGMCDV
jgi:hypothetical protein